MSLLLKITIVSLILFAVFAVFFTTPEEDQFARTADEGYYVKYAKVINEKGIAQFPVLLEQYLCDPYLQLYPQPARFGHTLTTALWFRFFPNTFLSLARFSFLCYVLFLGVSFYFSRKFFGSGFAYLYTLLLSSSPLIMTAGRRVLQDSYLNLFWALCLWIFLDFLVNKKKGMFFLFLAVFSMTVLIKENSAALMAFFVLAFLLYKRVFKQEISDNYLWGMLLIPFLLVTASYVLFLGSVTNVLRLWKFILFGMHFCKVPPTSYPLYAMGPWYKFIMDYLIVTPVTTLLCVGYLSHMVLARRFEEKQSYFASYLVLMYALFSSLKYTKIVRFVMSLDVAVSLLALLALYEIFKLKDKAAQTLWVFLACALIFFVNYQNFVYLFLELGIYDPISYWLLLAKKIIPSQLSFR